MSSLMLAQSAAQVSPDDPSGSPIPLLLGLAVVAVTLTSFWRLFQRAGEPGWATLVPIYNAVVLLRVAQRPLWWVLLMAVPLVNVAVLVAVNIALSHRFGRSTAFGVGLSLLPFVFLPLLAFGEPDRVTAGLQA